MTRMKYLFLLIAFTTFLTYSQTDSNKLDEKGLKHGLWKGFYEPSKRMRYQGTFNHGKEIGTFKYYDDNTVQVVVGTREFNDNDNSSYTTFFDQKGNKVSEGKSIGKLNEGVWKYYHEASKEIMTIENYKNGKLDGLRSVFYLSGKVAEECNYKNGVKEGSYKKYLENGIVLEATTFINGLNEGETVYKDASGNIASIGTYLKGKKVGIWKFYIDGKLEKEENFSKRKKRSSGSIKDNKTK